jgi:hypothetical protein
MRRNMQAETIRTRPHAEYRFFPIFHYPFDFILKRNFRPYKARGAIGPPVVSAYYLMNFIIFWISHLFLFIFQSFKI